MRASVIVLLLILFGVLGGGALAWSRYPQPFPKQSIEIATFNAEKRDILSQLRAEEKFEEHDYPPLGYTGIATAEDGVTARAAVNEVLDSILSRANGPIAAGEVSALIRQAMKRVNLLETEDRDRTSDYLIEIWYILGFKGATGEFAHGSAFSLPPGYGEPLPPGWKSPHEPRPIGRP